MSAWLAALIVRMSAWMVPADSRARWREEWLAEIDRVIGDRRSAIGDRRLTSR